MQSATSRDVLTVTAAALVGGVVAARWWARHHPLSASRFRSSDQDPVEDVRLVLHDPAAASSGAPEDVLRQHWNRLHALDFAPLRADVPVAPTA